MTTISELSDSPKFTINLVSQQTGILPVTLRAWERRHAVLSPYRAENRYRLYSERDVAILRWLKSRVDAGIMISSAISELRALTQAGDWPIFSQTSASLPALSERTGGRPAAYYARALYEALVKHEEDRCNSILREISVSLDLRTALLQVCAPALVEIGVAWYQGKIRVTTEHFASSYLRGRLLTLLQSLPIRRSMPAVLIGCAPGEQHEVGCLMLAVLLRREGYRVEYLGADVPLIDLADYAGYQKPKMIILSASMTDSATELTRFPSMLRRLRSQPLFGFGGEAFNQDPKLQAAVDGIFLGETIEAALDKTMEMISG